MSARAFMAKSALRSRLTEDQLTKLVDYAMRRLQQLDGERAGSGWFSKREKFEKIAASDYDHRKSSDLLNQSIFDLSNMPMQIVRSVRRFLLARVSKDMFGSAPWFAAKPEGRLDAVLADEIQKHADWKFRAARFTEKAKTALGCVLDLGDVPVKTTWKVETDVSEREATVLCDSKGKPVLTPDGDYIFDSDETVPLSQLTAEQQGVDELGEEESSPEADAVVSFPSPGQQQTGAAENPQIAQMDAEGDAAQPDADALVFRKAPEIALQPDYQWLPHYIEETTRLYNGLDVATCEWRDVLYPMNAPALELGAECDFIAHRYQVPLKSLRPRFDPDWQDDKRADADLAAVVDLLKNSPGEPQTEAAKPKEAHGEAQANVTDEENPPVKCTECYFLYDCFGDGIPRRIFLVLNEDNQLHIHVDYLATISPRAQAPIHLPAVNRVPGRAYGRGLYEVYELAQDAIDRLLNSVLYRNKGNSDPVKIFNPHNTLEGKADPNLRIMPGKTLTSAQKGIQPQDILSFIEMPDLDTRTWQLMELFMQLIQVESGVTNANQGDLSSLPSNGTATGVNSLLESSSVLHFFVLEELRDGLTPQVRYAIELIYFKQDEDETYAYLEGEADAVLSLSQAQQLRNLPMNVEILLTRAKQQAQREAAFAAIPFGERFYTMLATNPDAAIRLRPLYVQAFRGLEIDNADTFFPSAQEIQALMEAAAAAAMQQQQAAATAQPNDTGAEASPEQQAEAAPALPVNVIASPEPVAPAA